MTVSTTPRTRSRRALAPLLVLLVALAAVVAGCGDGGSSAGAPKLTDPAAKRGEKLADENGCQSCHRLDKDGTGPKWRDVAGSQVKLDGGETITADDAYLAESITDPKAKVVDGYPSIMPTAYDFSDEEVDDLVAYLRALSKNTPAEDAPEGDAPAETSTTTTPG